MIRRRIWSEAVTYNFLSKMVVGKSCPLAVAEWWSETMADGFRNQIDMMYDDVQQISISFDNWWDNQSRQHRNWCIDRI